MNYVYARSSTIHARLGKNAKNLRSPGNWQGFLGGFNLVSVFRCFPTNKSRKQNAETEQARPQLQFAPKIIKIRLLVLENELIDICMLVSKKC